ncbi:GFA family protein [Listeria fleischmannii]|jgi:hypothetical protein|uniref:GFA family protein n=1 Tax=Listeria fleischmannii TaxID=1069827 RepID=A0A841YER5_9LIST|nr:GFA family protein [Listeria fleischmannii]MBC1398720.1 GFA family protein [Listeria fleischmannii]MBC1418163.1 GFA family protein [Listeria fleischmannii]MBC1426936.1 GFA family protein [Listeria fleischmannii]STY35933.1 Uncharacterized conserved protein [Listeria fleischmannii subsp. coloradonensis]
MENLQGTCLCGAVSIEIMPKNHDIHACHCEMCRKWTAGPFLCIEASSHVTFSGEEYITEFPSSKWAKRGFCNKCGSTLFYHAVESNEYFMSSELFQLEDFRLVSEIYVDAKPAYYDFKNETKKWTEEEFLKNL